MGCLTEVLTECAGFGESFFMLMKSLCAFSDLRGRAVAVNMLLKHDDSANESDTATAGRRGRACAHIQGRAQGRAGCHAVGLLVYLLPEDGQALPPLFMGLIISIFLF